MNAIERHTEKYGLHAERTTLCAFKNFPSAANVQSTRVSLSNSVSNTDISVLWWLFHRRQNCWSSSMSEAGWMPLKTLCKLALLYYLAQPSRAVVIVKRKKKFFSVACLSFQMFLQVRKESYIKLWVFQFIFENGNKSQRYSHVP